MPVPSPGLKRACVFPCAISESYFLHKQMPRLTCWRLRGDMEEKQGITTQAPLDQLINLVLTVDAWVNSAKYN